MFQWINAIQGIVLVIVGALLWLVTKSFKGGQWSTGLLDRVGSLEKRMEQAGRETSDLATDVQGLPERFRREFDDRYQGIRVAQVIEQEARRDRERLWKELEHLWAVSREKKR